MLESASFFGIVISMYYNDHVPPHFHARYAEHEAEVAIESLQVLNGSLPRRALALVLEWVAVRASGCWNAERVSETFWKRSAAASASPPNGGWYRSD